MPCEDQQVSVGRFAPSPTGMLHIGNLRTGLAAWLFARAARSRFLLRFEDLDSATVQAEHFESQRRDLEILGLTWDGEAVLQSERTERYEAVLSDLDRAGLTYPCWCSRREIREAASAPHHTPGHYPGTCRRLSRIEKREREASGRPPALRLRTDGGEVEIVDRLHGSHRAPVDDLVLRRGDGTPAYNLVVVIDDAAQGVEEVVRADDLLSSTPRQAHLMDLLGIERPRWAHVPLVLAHDGDRLAKRHGSVTIHDRLGLGDSPEKVIGELARSLGLSVPEDEIRAAELIERFDPSSIRLEPWTLSPRQMTEPW